MQYRFISFFLIAYLVVNYFNESFIGLIALMIGEEMTDFSAINCSMFYDFCPMGSS